MYTSRRKKRSCAGLRIYAASGQIVGDRIRQSRKKADHGNDPTWTGTDHTREQVPLLVYSPSLKEGGKLPETDTFGVIGATVADNFEVKMPEGTIGTSILEQFK